MRQELLNNKKIYMAKVNSLWEQLSYQPSLFLTDSELLQYEANKAELIKELDFCNSILNSIRSKLN